MAELEELLDNYKRFPDVPLVLGDPEARLLIAALEEAWGLLRSLEWVGSSMAGALGPEQCCPTCKALVAWGHEEHCELARLLHSAEDKCD